MFNQPHLHKNGAYYGFLDYEPIGETILCNFYDISLIFIGFIGHVGEVMDVLHFVIGPFIIIPFLGGCLHMGFTIDDGTKNASTSLPSKLYFLPVADSRILNFCPLRSVLRKSDSVFSPLFTPCISKRLPCCLMPNTTHPPEVLEKADTVAHTSSGNFSCAALHSKSSYSISLSFCSSSSFVISCIFLLFSKTSLFCPYFARLHSKVTHSPVRSISFILFSVI